MLSPPPTSPTWARRSPGANARNVPKRRTRSISAASSVGNIWSRRVSMMDGVGTGGMFPPAPSCPRPVEGPPGSPLHFRLRSVIAAGHFVVPTALPILVGDAGSGTGHELFLRGPLRRPPRQVVGRKCLGENPVRAIRPTAVVLDDFVCDLGHDRSSSVVIDHTMIDP